MLVSNGLDRGSDSDDQVIASPGTTDEHHQHHADHGVTGVSSAAATRVSGTVTARAPRRRRARTPRGADPAHRHRRARLRQRRADRRRDRWTARPRRSSGTPAGRSCCRPAARSCSTRSPSSSSPKGCDWTSPARCTRFAPGHATTSTRPSRSARRAWRARASRWSSMPWTGSTFEPRGNAALVLGAGRAPAPARARAWCTWRARSSSPMRPAPARSPRLDAAEGAFDLILTPAAGGGWTVEGLLGGRRHRLLTGRSDRYPRCSMVELGGTWRAAVADDDLRRSWQDDAFDDAGWEAVDGPRPLALGRRPSPTPTARCCTAGRSTRWAPAEGRRPWLTFDGLFYQGDVWLDGVVPRRHRGLLRPPHLRGHRRACGPAASTTSPSRSPARASTTSPPSGTSPASSSTGTASTPTGTPAASGGRCASTETGPVRIARLRVLCREATPERAVLVAARHPRQRRGAARCRCAPRSAGSTTTPTTRSPPAPTTSSGRSRSTGRELWWPRALGDPTLHDLTRRGRARRRPRAAAPSDDRHLRTGLRQVRLRSWIASVNGERLFLKGSNQGPTRMALAEATPEELARDVALAVRRRPRPAAHPRPHHPTRALRRGRRGRPAPLAGPARCSGATPGASASRPCARPRPPSTCSATTRRSRSGAATTSRWPSRTTRTCGATRRRCDAWPSGPPPRRSCRPGTRPCSTAR